MLQLVSLLLDSHSATYKINFTTDLHRTPRPSHPASLGSPSLALGLLRHVLCLRVQEVHTALRVRLALAGWAGRSPQTRHAALALHHHVDCLSLSVLEQEEELITIHQEVVQQDIVFLSLLLTKGYGTY